MKRASKIVKTLGMKVTGDLVEFELVFLVLVMTIKLCHCAEKVDEGCRKREKPLNDSILNKFCT